MRKAYALTLALVLLGQACAMPQPGDRAAYPTHIIGKWANPTTWPHYYPPRMGGSIR